MGDGRQHIAIIPFPAQGHINATMHLACKLARQGGIRILYITHHTLVDAAIGSREQCYESLIRVVGLEKGGIEPKQWKGVSLVAMWEVAQEMEEPLEELLKTLHHEGDGVDRLITDFFVPKVQDVADRLGIPNLVFWTASGCAAVPNFQIKELHEQGLIPVQDAIAARGNCPIEGMPGLGKYTLRDLPFAFYNSDQENIAMRISAIVSARKAAGILLNTFEELEGDSVDLLKTLLPNVWTVGPFLPEATRNAGVWQEDQHCLQWLDEQAESSVVYISFGSLASLSTAQVEELGMGIEASGLPFLWVVHPNLIEGSETCFLKGFSERTRKRGMIISWAPQLEVLSHPSIGLFVSHCGWNSCLESICIGVPLLAWPCFAEQNVNARFVVNEWKLGVGLDAAMLAPGSLVKREEVEKALLLGLRSQEAKKNAREMSAKAKAKRATFSSLAFLAA